MTDKIRDAGGIGHDFDKEKGSAGQRQLLMLARAVLVKRPQAGKFCQSYNNHNVPQFILLF